MDRVGTKLLLEVAAEGLYESLHRGQFGEARFKDIPEEERQLWKDASAKWISNFLAASHDLVTEDLKGYLEEAVLKHEFPMDATSQMMVVRSEVLLSYLKKFASQRRNKF